MPLSSDDPDNPPLTGREVWGSGRAQIAKRIAAHKAKYAARQAQLPHCSATGEVPTPSVVSTNIRNQE